MQDAIYQSLFKSFVDVGSAHGGDDFLNRLDSHLAISLALVLEVAHDAINDFANTNFVAEVNCSLYNLLVVPPVKRHAPDPEELEEVVKYSLLQVACSHTAGAGTLRDNLQDNLFHFLIRRLELTDEDLHDLAGVVVRVFLVHERDDVSHGFEETGETLTTLLARASPKRVENLVEALDTEWVGGFSQRSQSEGSDCADLRLFIVKVVADAVNKTLQVWKYGTAHKDGNLLHDLDTGVTRLPRLLALADSLQERKQCWNA